MGTYLSTPVLDKCEEDGAALEDTSTPVAWGVVDMQGWRKSMEDAHVAQTDVRPPRAPPPDGGGGEEEEEEEGGGEGGDASSSSSPAKVFAVFDGHGGPEVARFCQLYLVDVLTTQEEWRENADVGKALVESFHAIDRMVDDPSRRDELIKLRSEKPKPGERASIADGAAIPAKEAEPAPAHVADPAEEGKSSEKKETEDAGETDEKESDFKDVEVDGYEEESKEGAASAEKPAADNAEGDAADAKKAEEGDGGDDKVESKEDSAGDDDEADEDSDVAVGDEAEIAAPLEGSEEDSDDSDEDGEEGIISTADAMALFQKLLTMSGASGKVSVEVESGDAEDDDNDGAEEESAASDNNAAASGDVDAGGTPPAEKVVKMGPDVSQPTRIQNGRQVCNLPDHPIHAGCTSVVAVLVGKTLTVANAGDSRAVLCRAGGGTEALSFDHKPLQEREMKRITEAGGFVNQFGRVNGNLNLSRSIGDMKYKQVPGIPPCGQMITAEPDILQVTLNEGDEFIILGCDGIWDCLTNEEAVKYVRDRIDEKTPVEIGREMLDEIVSEDPRASQGIGGDNMTVMIVDLLPQTRSYRK